MQCTRQMVPPNKPAMSGKPRETEDICLFLFVKLILKAIRCRGLKSEIKYLCNNVAIIYTFVRIKYGSMNHTHTEEVIGIRNLTMHFEDHIALNNMNLSIGKGEIFCLLGQNGAGKTTTINILLGFLKPTSGEVVIGRSEDDPRGFDSRKSVAYIPEVVQLYGNMTGMENLDFFSRLAGFRYDATKLAGFLVKAGLQVEAHEKRMSAYSKGMRQKVGIGIALAKGARIILMDEPTSGLDPKASSDFIRICKDLAKEGCTILMATHDIFNAVNVGNRIGIMKEGTLVHTIETSRISATELEKLYLETI